MGRTNSAVGLGGEFKIDERSLNANLEDEAYCKLVDTSLQYLKYIYSPMEHLFFCPAKLLFDSFSPHQSYSEFINCSGFYI